MLPGGQLIAAHAATATLAATLGQRLAVNHNALTADDAPLQAAIQTALVAMASGRSVHTGTGGRSAVTRQAGASGLTLILAQPSEPQSGVIVGPSDNLLGLQITNTRRRNLLLYITQTGYDDAQGTHHTVDIPLRRGAFPADWIAATNKLSGALGSVVDVLANNGAYQPVKSGVIPLPLNPTTAKKSYYRVTLAGPGLDPGSAAKEGESRVRADATEMLTFGFMKDIFLPLLFAAMDIKLNLEEVATPVALFTSIKGLVAIISGFGHVVLSLSDFHPKEVGIAIIKTLNDDYVFRQAMLRGLTEFVFQLGANADVLNSAETFLTKISFFLAFLDKAFALGDASVTANDWGQSDYFEEWEVTAAKANVRVLPDAPTVYNLDTLALTAQTLATGDLVYHWKTSGAWGHLVDTKGHSGPEFDSTDRTVTYVGDRTPAAGAAESDTVSATIYVIPETGGTQNRLLLGTGTTTVARRRRQSTTLSGRILIVGDTTAGTVKVHFLCPVVEGSRLLGEVAGRNDPSREFGFGEPFTITANITQQLRDAAVDGEFYLTMHYTSGRTAGEIPGIVAHLHSVWDSGTLTWKVVP